MSNERLIRRVLNFGKVERGKVTEVGMEVVQKHQRIKPQPGLHWRVEQVTSQVPAFEIETQDGKKRTLNTDQDTPVEVGDEVEFGERIALWSKVNS